MTRQDLPHIAKLKERNRTRSQNLGRKRTHEDRRVSTLLGRQKAAAIQKDIEGEWQKQDQAAMTLAIKHGKSLSFMTQHLQRLSRFTKKNRGVNKWNAFIFTQSLKPNGDLPPNEKARLQELQTIAKEASSYADVAPSDIDAMKKLLEEFRELKVRGPRKDKNARGHDISHTTQYLKEELANFDMRCRMSSFFVTARNSLEHVNGPDYYANGNIRGFFKTVFNTTVEDFCMKYDSYSALGLKGLAKNDNERRTNLKKHIRELIGAGLRTTTENNDAKMCWKNYEGLVKRYKVVLEGWPNPVFDPNDLGYQDLEFILSALLTSKCAWRKLSDDEVRMCEEQYIEKLGNGEIEIRKRKKRSDAGKKRRKVVHHTGSEDNDN